MASITVWGASACALIWTVWPDGARRSRAGVFAVGHWSRRILPAPRETSDEETCGPHFSVGVSALQARGARSERGPSRCPPEDPPVDVAPRDVHYGGRLRSATIDAEPTASCPPPRES
jgi:hypothetical protein